MKRTPVVATLTLSATFLGVGPGCEQRASTSTASYAYQVDGDKVPVQILLEDGTLMRVTQRGNWIFFYKTSQGYGEHGIDAQRNGSGGGIDWAKGNIYTKINYLEALAFFDNDWTKIYNAVVEQSGRVANSVDPALIRKTLERLVTRNALFTLNNPNDPSFVWEKVEPYWAQYASGDRDRMQPLDSIHTDDMTNPFADITTVHCPVYIRLPDNNLLKITERSVTSAIESDSDVRFYKTSSGYSVAGGRITVGGNGGGAEKPIGMQYDEISAVEALAFLGNDLQRLMNPVNNQNRIISLSVEPESVQAIFDDLARGNTAITNRINPERLIRGGR